MKNLLVNNNYAIAFILLLSNLFLSAQVVAEQVSIENGYVRATIPGTNVSSAYMEITNDTNKPVILLAASATVSDRIEIHQHSMENCLMKMRKQASLTIPANGKVILQPGGYHLMIFNLSQGLQIGENVPLTLQFQDGEALQVTLPVKSIVREKQQHSHHHH